MDAGQIMMTPAAVQAAGMQLEGANQIDLVARNSGFDQLLTSVVQETQKQDVLLPEKDAGSVEVDFDLKRQEQNGMTLDPAILQMMASLFATPDAHISAAVNSADVLAADTMPVGVIAEMEVQPQARVEVQPQTRVEVQPQTRVEVQPQTRVEVQPQARVEVQPQARVEVQPQARVEVQPQARVEVQPQARVEVQPQARVEVQPQTRVEVQPQARVEVQPQARVEVQPQARVEVQPQARVEVQPQTRVEVQPQTRVEVQPQTRVEVQPQARVEVQPQARVEVQPQARVEVQPQARVEVQPQARVEVQPQTRVEVQPQTRVEVQPQTRVEVQPQTRVEVQPQTRVEVQPQARVEVQPQTRVEVQPQARVEVQPQARVEVQPQARVEVQPQARVEAEQTTKSPIAWLVYGRPVQMTNQTTAGQQALQVSGETRETGSTPAILMSRTTESDVVIPGLAVSSLDETGMQHGQSEPGTAHQFGATVQPNLMAVQGHAGETPAVDSEKAAVSDQVARQVVTHLKPSGREQGGDQSVTFRLSPEHLGDIQLSMHMDAKQGVKIEIVAENRGVRETLLQQADDLRETLARQNIKMDSFDVSTGLGGGASQQTRDWRQQVALQQQSQRVTGVERNLFRETAEIPIRYIEAQYQSTLDVRF